MRILFAFLTTVSLMFATENKSLDIDYNDYEEWHEYSGLATLGLVGATVLTQWNRGLHEGFGTAAAISMLATSGIGIYAHKDDVLDLSDGLKKEHWHAILGAVATVAMIASVSSAPEESHAALGVAGGLTAGLSFVIAKW